MLPRNTRTEQFYHMIFNHCVEGVMIINREGNIVLLNPHAAEMMEYEPEELINCSVNKIIPGDYTQQHDALIEKFFHNPVPRPIGRGLRMNAKKKSGAILPVEISLSPLEVEGKEYVISQVVDMSHRVEMEERVKIIEAHQKAILDSTVSHLILLDTSGNIKSFNKTVAEWTEKNIGKPFKKNQPFSQWLPGKYRGKFETLLHAAKSGTFQRIEAYIYRRWFLVNLIPFFEGELIKGLCIDARIIDEQKQYQKALIEREAFTQSVLSSLSAIIAVINQDGHIMAVNQAWKRFGAENSSNVLPVSSTGVNYLDTCKIAADQGDSYAARAYEGIKEVLKGKKQLFSMEYPCHSPNEKRWYTMRVTPFEAPTKGAVIAHEDITKRKLAEEAIRESEQKYSSLVSAMAEGIVLQTATGEIITCNPSAERILGLTKDQMTGRTSNDPRWRAIKEDGSPFPGEEHPSMITLRTGKPCSNVIMGVHKPNGQLRWISINSQPVINEGDEKPYAVVTSFSDITKQKRAEEKLKGYSLELERRVTSRTEALRQNLEIEIAERKRVQERLIKSKEETQQALIKEKELNELKSRFVSMASHEFRTPLATILSSINLINKYESANTNQRVEKHIDRIRTNVRHLTNMLNDFLSLSKLEEGLEQAKPDEIIITQFTNDVIEEMLTQVKAGQEIIYEHKGENSLIYQDSKMLRNVLHNLISNAIKYSPEDKQIYIHTSLHAITLTIEVQDQGIGIPEKDQPHLFTRFFRAHNASNIQGTGLGLNIVKRYVELMGGSISFTSVANQGTSFFIHLPQNLNATIS